MRIVQLTGYTGAYGGSFVPMMAAAADAARERGWEVHAVFLPAARERPWLSELRDRDIEVHVVADSGRRARLRMAQELAGDGPAVLHSHFTTFDLASASAARRRPQVASIWHLHSRQEPGARGRLGNVLKWRVWGRHVDRVLCVAPNIAEAAVERGAPAGRVQLWPNAVDLARFCPPTAERRREARLALSLPPEARVIVHFGWDWERKGGDLFLEALRLLRDEGANVLGLTVGGGTPARELIAALGLEGHARAVEPVEDPRLLHAAADLFVTSSRAEGMPFGMAEALASGVPVVATDIPGQRLIGEGLEACRLSPPEPAAIAAAAGELLARSPDDAAVQARAARARLVETMGLDSWASRLADLYADLVPGRAGAAGHR